MNCLACRQVLAPGARFCGACGTPVGQAEHLECPSCKAANPRGHRFCHACGAGLLLAPAHMPAAAPATAPATARAAEAVPKPERIVLDRSTLEGERKQVTVLFADLKGSMELLAGRDPEVARSLLDAVIERMVEAVRRYEGTVNQVMGDGIMALFGAPQALEDHALRACHAALRMQDAVRQYGRGLKAGENLGDDKPVQIRVGINSGEVVVRAIDSDLRLDYTAVGQTTHLAARMEQLAEPGSIVLGPSSHALVQGLVEVRSLGARAVKGLSDAVELFELLGIGVRRARLLAGRGRELTPFVGRGDELAALRSAFAQAEGGQGQVVTLVGEPGNGKSRLLHELVREPALQHWLVLATGAESTSRGTPYLPLVELLQGYFQLDTRDAAAATRARLASRVLALDPALAPALVPLLGMFELAVEDEEWARLDPPQRRRRSFDALRQLLLRASRDQPLAVIFENLQWTDNGTLAFLETFVDALAGARIVLVGSCRPEFRPPWTSKAWHRQVRVDGLPPAVAAQFLGALIGADASVRPLGRMLLERTEGNPFFIEESVRALLESKALSRVASVVRLDRPLEVIQVPATVQAVLAARIDRLAPEDKHILQAASAIGRDLVLPLVCAVAQVPREAVRQSLARLEAAELLYETAAVAQTGFAFKHALTQSVAYGSLLLEQRRTLHARVVPALEALYAGHLGEQVDQLARHSLQGQLWDKAFGYLREAARRAAGRCAYRESAAWVQDALDIFPRLAPTPDSTATAIDLRLSLRLALLPLGRFDEILQRLHEAEALAEALGDGLLRGRVSASLAASFWWRGEAERALDAATRAQTIADASGELELGALARTYTGQIRYTMGEYRASIDTMASAVKMVRGKTNFERIGFSGPLPAFAQTWMVFSQTELGNFAQALEQAERATRITDAARHSYMRVVLLSAHAYVYILQGQVDTAIEMLERIQGLTATDFPAQRPQIDSRLGRAYTLAGRVPEAIALLEPAVEQLARTFIANLSIQLAWLAEAYLLAGNLPQARTCADDALAMARRCNEAGNQAWVLRMQGEIARRQSPPDLHAGEAAYRQALEIASRLGMRPLVAQCHAGLSTLHRESGHEREADAHRATAAKGLRELGMTWWLDRLNTGEMELTGRQT